MKRTMTTLGALMIGATPAFAAGTPETGTSLLTILFFGFGALIVVCQFLPGSVLFCTMLKGIFGKAHKKDEAKA